MFVAPPGGGNIGDQAIFEAYLESTEGPVVAVFRRAGDLTVPESAAGRVRTVAMGELLYGAGLSHFAQFRQFLGLLSDAATLSIGGADIMDGRYNLQASTMRSLLAEAGARFGVGTRILGFSWNSRPHPLARRALRAASAAGAVPMLRDPQSSSRAARDGVAGIVDVADIVFASRAVDRSVRETIDSGGRPLALVNVSGLISRSFDQDAEYARIIAHLQQIGHHVVLVPHVLHWSADDSAACRRVAVRTGPAHLTLVDRLLTPSQVRGLTHDASIAITGRMHLAVMTLGVGAPAVTLATQGKVEGLMELLGTPELCVEPAPGFGYSVCEVIDRVIPSESATRRAIGDALPGVVALARRNTAGMPVVAVRGAE